MYETFSSTVSEIVAEIIIVIKKVRHKTRQGNQNNEIIVIAHSGKDMASFQLKYV
jgi:hypothetical protein